MMIHYKSMYYHARHYMSKKSQKWGIKAWCLADSKLYVYDFDIYCYRNGIHRDIALVKGGELLLAHNIVMKLMKGNQWKGHCIVMNNYFTSIGFLRSCFEIGLMPTNTLHQLHRNIATIQEYEGFQL